VVIERLPEILRVEVLLLAGGKDYRDALARLNARCARAREWLVKLGASEGGIALSDPAIIRARPKLRPISAPPNDGLAPVDDPSPRAAPPPDGGARQVPATVSERLRVDLPLKATGPDDLLIVAEELQRRIKEADLAGIKELGEDAQQLEIPGCGACGAGVEPGAPSFLFVSRIGAQDRANSLALAFGRARSEARRLAHATGCELGGLRSLSGTNSGGLSPFGLGTGPFAPGNPPQMNTADPARGTSGPSPEDHDEEAIGLTAGKVQYRIAVTATFALRPPAEE
jgi:hypothetical protein